MTVTEMLGACAEKEPFLSGLAKSGYPEGKSSAVALTLLWAGPRMAAVNTSMVS